MNNIMLILSVTNDYVLSAAFIMFSIQISVKIWKLGKSLDILYWPTYFYKQKF